MGIPVWSCASRRVSHPSATEELIWRTEARIASVSQRKAESVSTMTASYGCASVPGVGVRHHVPRMAGQEAASIR